VKKGFIEQASDIKHIFSQRFRSAFQAKNANKKFRTQQLNFFSQPFILNKLYFSPNFE
jgi:hypothetical protein